MCAPHLTNADAQHAQLTAPRACAQADMMDARGRQAYYGALTQESRQYVWDHREALASEPMEGGKAATEVLAR